MANKDLGVEIKNKSEDAKTEIKKGVRKAKKGVRKTLGTNTPGKDLNDSLGDTQDEMTSSVKKLKNKIQN